MVSRFSSKLYADGAAARTRYWIIGFVCVLLLGISNIPVTSMDSPNPFFLFTAVPITATGIAYKCRIRPWLVVYGVICQGIITLIFLVASSETSSIATQFPFFFKSRSTIVIWSIVEILVIAALCGIIEKCAAALRKEPDQHPTEDHLI
ncbi:MAG TPA: hypothetical protein VFE24_00400 [Pirellulales bacterium]|jgi:hypothetical protein|nr:hypothetical protein [Pirellulales bacterium]